MITLFLAAAAARAKARERGGPKHSISPRAAAVKPGKKREANLITLALPPLDPSAIPGTGVGIAKYL